MSFRPPIPTGSTLATRWFKWFQDAIREIEVKQSAGALVRRTSRGTFIDFQNQKKSAAAAPTPPQFESFGFSIDDNYVTSNAVVHRYAVSVTSTINCSVGSLPFNFQPFSLLDSVPAIQSLPTTLTVRSGFPFLTVWRHGRISPADTMPTEVVIQAFGTISFNVPSGLPVEGTSLGHSGLFLWGRVKS
jgi:hypothetical protein